MKTQRILLLVTVLNAGVSLRTAAATQYHITDLGSLSSGPSSFSDAAAINNSGVVVGQSSVVDSFGNQYYSAITWSAGGMQRIPTQSGTNSVASAINDAGQVGGEIGSNGVGGLAFSWTPGSGIQNFSDGSQSWITGINSSGQFSGYSGFSSQTSNGVFWNSFADPMQIVGTFATTLLNRPITEARGIDSSGVVVGHTRAGSGGTQHAFTWTVAGGLVDIANDPTDTIYSFANAINDSGQIVGSVNGQASALVPQAVIWNSDLTIHNIPVPANASSSTAVSINDNGIVLGNYTVGSQTTWFTWSATDGLNNISFDNSGTGWSSLNFTDINDLGQIVGSGINPDGLTRGFVLLPEPPTVALLAVGVVLGFLFNRPIARRLRASASRVPDDEGRSAKRACPTCN